MARYPLSDTPYSTGPADDLPVVSVLGISSEQVINNANMARSDITSAVQDGRNVPDAIKNALKNLKDSILRMLYTRSDLMDRLSKLLGGDLSILLDMAPDRLNMLLDLLAKNSTNNRLDYNGTRSSYSGGEYQDIEDITSLLNTINDDPESAKIIDLEAEKILYSALVENLIKLGVPEAVNDVLAKASDPSVKEGIVIGNLVGAAEKGDLDTLTSLVNEVPPGLILTKIPNIISLILTNFTFPKGTERKDYQAMSDKLIALLNKINPFWYLTVRNNATISWMKDYMAASNDALTLLEMQPLHLTPSMIARSYKISSINQLIKRSYPMLPSL